MKSLLAAMLLAGCAKSTAPVPTLSVEASAAPSAFVLPSANPASPAPTSKPAVATPKDAIAAFRAGWTRDVMRTPKDAAFVTRMDPVIARHPEHFSAKRVVCRTARAEDAKFFADLHWDYTVYGSMAALDRDGDCFAIEYIKGMKEDVKGYVSLDGDVLFVWQIPEG